MRYLNLKLFSRTVLKENFSEEENSVGLDFVVIRIRNINLGSIFKSVIYYHEDEEDKHVIIHVYLRA